MSGGMDLYTRWSHEMRRRALFRAGERVGVAVSGGPDSVLLLAFMEKLGRDLGLAVAAVHFNHRLRGEESDADERFVRQRADELGIEILQGEADVARVAQEKHRNLEATARELRYRFFFSLINQGRLEKVATAHTANDQAETILMRLLRGTGTRGLGGIYPILDGKIVRPFLNVTRAEVERELQKRNLEWRLDSSNSSPRFQRNKIRMGLLPQLEKDFNPEIVHLLNELAERARDDEEYLEQQAHDRARLWRVREGQEEKIPIRSLLEFPPAVSRRVLRQMILASRGSLRSITYRHIENLRRFAGESQSGRKLVFPGGVEVRRDFDWLIIAPRDSCESPAEYCLPVKIPGEIIVPQVGLIFRFKILGANDPPAAYNDSGLVGLDPLKTSGKLVLRNWRAGDRWSTSGSARTRNLKEFFDQRKIPLSRRKIWPVLACGERIVWTQGLASPSAAAATGRSDRFLVSVARLEPER
jgi:tRNA(Ile)-lysidine synthase